MHYSDIVFDRPIYAVLITCQDMINNEAKFTTIVEFLKIAKEVYGKDTLIAAMKKYRFTQLISLLDF